jgi:ligand-binding sensor domain-containing protein
VKVKPYKIAFLIWLILTISDFVHLYAGFPPLGFKRFTMDDGLTSDNICSIYQDRDGFMWFGSNSGIDKFDGENFRSYQNLFIDTIEDFPLMTSIIEDESGLFWIATNKNGIILFDKRKETCTRIKHDPSVPESLSSNEVISIYRDSKNNIWVATWNGGLNLWNGKGNSFTHYKHNPTDLQSLGSDYISSVAEDSMGNIWIAASDGMLIRLDTETKLFKNFRFPIKSTTEANQWSRPFVFVDSQDNVFHGSEAGLCILDHKTQKMKYLTCFNPESKGFFYITSMLEMEKDVYLISTFYEGLYI